jgi:hypothetical protein
MRTAARRATSCATARSASPYRRAGCVDTRVIVPRMRPRAASGTHMKDWKPSSVIIRKCSSSRAVSRRKLSVMYGDISG